MTIGRRRALRSFSCTALLAVATCGGNNTTSDLSPAAKAKWNEYCAYMATCQSTSPCAATTCMARVAEEEPLIEFVDCQLAKTCDVNDDDCVAAAGTTDAEREDFTARCLAKVAMPGCARDPGFCTIVAYPLIRKQHMRAVDACLTVPCGDFDACVGATLDPLSCF